MISSRPNQKTGSEFPANATVVSELSSVEYCRSAVMMPRGMAMTSVTSSAVPMSRSVFHSRSLISSTTGRLDTNEVPQSPVSTLPSHFM